jgi:hypothetical protein
MQNVTHTQDGSFLGLYKKLYCNKSDVHLSRLSYEFDRDSVECFLTISLFTMNGFNSTPKPKAE